MKKLILNEEESKDLEECGSVEIQRNGFDILVEKDYSIESGYVITLINPYEIVLTRKGE